MSKHTPGPWTVRRYKAGYEITTPTATAEAVVTRLVSASFHDARLIGAAPDLLEALREITDRLGALDLYSGEGTAELSSAIVIATDRARAAIAKAEGR